MSVTPTALRVTVLWHVRGVFKYDPDAVRRACGFHGETHKAMSFVSSFYLMPAYIRIVVLSRSVTCTGVGVIGV